MRQEPPSSASQPESAAVLLVDDNPANLLALEAVLAPLGVRTVNASSGEEAIEHIEREPFAVALVDVQMPDMDGFELTRHIRQTEYGRELPVLFITAIHRDEIYVKRGYASGAADYITKPFDPDIVRARVRGFVNLYEQRESVRRGQVAERTQERDEALRRLIAFERIATAALETSDLKALLDELLAAFIGAADAADMAAIFLCEGGWLKLEAAVGPADAESLDKRIKIGEGFTGKVAAERRPQALSDAQHSTLVRGSWAKTGRVRGLYGVPLLHSGELVGVAYIGSTRASSFSDAEKRLFGAAAERAAMAVDRHLEVSRMEAMLTAAPACIAIVQVTGYELSFVNPACAELFGPNLLGSCLDATGFGPEALGIVREVAQTGETGELSELEVSAHDAARRYLRFTAQPLRSSSGEVGRVLLFGVDVTDQVLARREIEATQAARVEMLERERAARQSAELASTSKDEFLATVSHELRTPLNAILGWSTLARSKPGIDTRRALSIIERNARAQARIVEDVLDFSRIARGKMRLTVGPLDLTAVVSEALEAVRPAAEAKGLELSVKLELDEPLLGDADRIQQVVWNLLANAVKFTSSGGRVEIASSREAGTAVLRVIDTGQGIEPEFIPFLFEPFRQANGSTTRRHGGLGLGLAIVRQIVQAHGGTIRAESQGVGLGASFVIELPLDGALASCADSALEGPPSSRVGPASSQRLDGLKILLVDDEEDSRELMAHVLAGRGAEVTSCCSVQEFISRFPEIRPDVLVSDLAMPGADGYELMRWLRRLPVDEGGQTPAVAVTAHARREAREQALRAGYQRHTPKPIDINSLVSTIAELGGVPALAGSR
ncbi:MAG TPA: response regulator [Polyangiaceae bacterium]|nr:response regulator [Polyangiaceae bacterium]